MLDTVVGQDRQRPLRRQVALQQPGGQPQHARSRVAVRGAGPEAVGATLEQEIAIRFGFGPVFEPEADARRVFLQWHRRAQDLHPIRPLLQRNRGRSEQR